MKRKYWPLLALLLLSLSYCGTVGGPIEGQVLDIDTKKPVAGAIVVAAWTGTYSALVDSSTSCYHVETATTDSEGRYRIPFWIGKWKGPFFSADRRSIQSYKAGYTELSPYDLIRKDHEKIRRDYERENILYLNTFKGTREERLIFLIHQTGYECGEREDYANKLMPLYRALYEEAQQIARTDFEKYVAAGLEYNAHRLLLASEQSALAPYPRREKSQLLWAIERNQIYEARTLLDSGADPNDRDNDGITMLMIAIRYGYSEMAILLLEHGADPNATTFDGQKATAMDYLIARNNDYKIANSGKIAEMMIQKGYDINHRSITGKTDLEKAMAYESYYGDRNAEIVKVLREHAQGKK